MGSRKPARLPTERRGNARSRGGPSAFRPEAVGRNTYEEGRASGTVMCEARASPGGAG